MLGNEELVLRLVELKGDYNQFGIEQGKELIALPNWDHLRKLTINENEEDVKELIKGISPNLYQELKGLAEGLDLDLDATIKHFSGYDVRFPKMGCTTLINDGYYARNYDFSPELYDARLVITNPTNGYASVGFSHQVIGRLDGMNEKGLVVGLHFVNNEHSEKGFVATTIVRMLLEQCANIEDTVSFIKTIPHGYCYNYSITDQSGKSIIIEASPDQQVINFSNPRICTNHFESDILRMKNSVDIQGSLKRKEYVSCLLRESLSPIAAYHHFNDETSPLFSKYYKEYFGTLHTVVYSPDNLSIIVGVGGNCKPLLFSLKEFMDGISTLPKSMEGTINQVM
ncbi:MULTISPECIES: C45 family autoproteolytic acyltransferase/hydolase [Paraliobacillus]|uniref:C45 family autoproteolytic acyltransferase/hydolase n=1 Tax=Paraliobacillus TaxID=200903 RepID=UPI000DD3EE2E|nr:MULTISPECIES: C45 family peptidase [Paraliobacillus]